MEEFFDVYTRDGVWLGVKSKAQCHSEDPGCYHKPVWVWIINRGCEILVQRRAAQKHFHPNLWDAPSAGHVLAGESSLQGAVRETREELGLAMDAAAFRYMGQYVCDSTHEIGQIYLLQTELCLGDLVLQQEEVAEVRALGYSAFAALVRSDAFVPMEAAYTEFVLKMLREHLHIDAD